MAGKGHLSFSLPELVIIFITIVIVMISFVIAMIIMVVDENRTLCSGVSGSAWRATMIIIIIITIINNDSSWSLMNHLER